MAGCGGAVVDVGDAGSDAGVHRDGHGGTTRDQTNDQPNVGDATTVDVYPIYHDDACVDAPVEPPPIECDPFATVNQCSGGRSCFPIPPRATDNCNPGRYGTLCLFGGTGTQGTPCENGSECAGGFICVKSGAGDQCVKLCRTNQYDSCGDGRICREVDVTGSGWGGCE
jgi:hypothetical protein